MYLPIYLGVVCIFIFILVFICIFQYLYLCFPLYLHFFLYLTFLVLGLAAPKSACHQPHLAKYLGVVYIVIFSSCLNLCISLIFVSVITFVFANLSRSCMHFHISCCLSYFLFFVSLFIFVIDNSCFRHCSSQICLPLAAPGQIFIFIFIFVYFLSLYVCLYL